MFFETRKKASSVVRERRRSDPVGWVRSLPICPSTCRDDRVDVMSRRPVKHAMERVERVDACVEPYDLPRAIQEGRTHQSD